MHLYIHVVSSKQILYNSINHVKQRGSKLYRIYQSELDIFLKLPCKIRHDQKMVVSILLGLLNKIELFLVSEKVAVYFLIIIIIIVISYFLMEARVMVPVFKAAE